MNQTSDSVSFHTLHSAEERVRNLPDAHGSLGLEVFKLEVNSPTESKTEANIESALVVLSGTHDLFAGGGSWIARGRRASVHAPDESPVAVFLPPKTPFALRQGDGEAVRIFASRPEPKAAAPTGREKLKQSPLLAMAGSGKAYDSESGTWKPAESFPDAPQAVLPRMIEQTVPSTGVRVARIFGPEYKTQTLCVFEVIVEAGHAVDLGGLMDGGDAPGQALTLARCDGAFAVGSAAEPTHAQELEACFEGVGHLHALKHPVWALVGWLSA